VPVHLQHNLRKYLALKKVHYLTAKSGIEGDYLDFGVFSGSSLAHSIRAYNSISGVDNRKYKTQFYGFDSLNDLMRVKKNIQTTLFLKMKTLFGHMKKLIKEFQSWKKNIQ
jgi:hypothetical protein